MPLHPSIESYLIRRGLADAARDDGRATVLIDEKYRIHLAVAPSGWLVTAAKLCVLPPRGAARDEFFISVGKHASAMLVKDPSTCVVDPRVEALWLQRIHDPATDALGVDEAIGEFVNALSSWLGVVQRAGQKRSFL